MQQAFGWGVHATTILLCAVCRTKGGGAGVLPNGVLGASVTRDCERGNYVLISARADERRVPMNEEKE